MTRAPSAARAPRDAPDLIVVKRLLSFVSTLYLRGVDREPFMFGLFQKRFGAVNLLRRAMGDQDELACLELRFILQNAVLRDTDAHQGRPQGAQTAHHHRTFQRPDDPGDERTGHHDWTDARNEEEGGSEEQAP